MHLVGSLRPIRWHQPLI